MGEIEPGTPESWSPARNESASDKYLGRLYRLHPEHAPGPPKVKTEKPRVETEVVYIPTGHTLEDRIARISFAPQQIILTVAEFYGCSFREITGRTRLGPVVRARHVAMYLCHKLIGASLSDIGRRFDRDHTTSLNGIRRITSKMKKDERLVDEIELLKMKLADVAEHA